MKRVNFLMIFFFSFIAFSLEKPGIKEYDNLDFSRGEIIAYYDKDSNYTENEELAMFYRKVFSESKGMYIVSDFYKQTNTPQLIFKMTDLSDDDTKTGKEASYDVFGTLLYVADLKTGMFNGKYTSYKNGKIDYIADYLQNELTGLYIKYLDNKKVYQSEYKTGVLDGETIIYNSDGTESMRKIFKNDKLTDVMIKNYKLQKTDISEYDNLDFKHGTPFVYYNSTLNLVSEDSEDKLFYRKVIKKENDLYLVVDFLMYSDVLFAISKVRNPKDKELVTNEGYYFQFYDNGNISVKSFYKTGKLDGDKISYDAFGAPSIVESYTNGKMKNIKYLNFNLDE